MPDNGRYRRKPKKKGIPGLVPVIIIFLCTVLIIGGLELFYFKDNGEGEKPTRPTADTEVTTEPTTEPTEPPIEKIATATISSTGDLLMHLPVINSGKSADGTYDFTDLFRKVAPYVQKADYAVANLETTLYGERNGKKFSGYPAFNCPDEIVDGAKDAGFDMLLTANNHSNDTGYDGIARTLEVIDERGLDRLGFVKDDTEKKYLVKDINGIKVGMLCYTYETDDTPGKVALNGIPLNSTATGMVNAFAYGELDTFYNTVSRQLADMKADGAEATILYIHWGVEYLLAPNSSQKTIAQKLCDLGVDVIVGGHPHVVEPVELLTSTVDESHKTVCLYSMGNAVSNQRRGNSKLFPAAGNTEDGVLFSVTFAKYSDGTVLLENTEALPLWVNVYSGNSGKVYEILPLDNSVTDWKTALSISDSAETEARASYTRTMKLVEQGVTDSQTYLDSIIKPDSEEYKLLLESTAVPEETVQQQVLPDAGNP